MITCDKLGVQVIAKLFCSCKPGGSLNGTAWNFIIQKFPEGLSQVPIINVCINFVLARYQLIKDSVMLMCGRMLDKYSKIQSPQVFVLCVEFIIEEC